MVVSGDRQVVPELDRGDRAGVRRRSRPLHASGNLAAMANRRQHRRLQCRADEESGHPAPATVRPHRRPQPSPESSAPARRDPSGFVRKVRFVPYQAACSRACSSSVGTGRGDQRRDVARRRFQVQPPQQIPPRRLPGRHVDDQRIRLSHDDPGEHIRFEVAGGDGVALVLEQLPDDEQEVGRAVDGEDVLARRPLAIVQSLPPHAPRTTADGAPSRAPPGTGRAARRCAGGDHAARPALGVSVAARETAVKGRRTADRERRHPG